MMKEVFEIYQVSSGIEIEVQFESDTVWLSQDQLSVLFQRDQSVISRHLSNVFKEGELEKKSNMQKVHIPNSDKPISYYNLEVIISVGYRVKSIRGTQFRQWATQRLKDFLIKGIAVNEKRLEQLGQEVEVLKSGIRILSRVIEEKSEGAALDWLADFSKGLTLLDDYDHENLDEKGLTKAKAIYPEVSSYYELIDSMRTEFNTSVFGIEKDKSFESAVNQITKGMDGQDFYSSIEEKAAVLLYLITKNHAFTDGNKRIAAASMLLFLRTNDLLFDKNGQKLINDDALAALTLFTAASQPEEMETVKRLIVSVLNRNNLV
jgi:death-on-curing family protein